MMRSLFLPPLAIVAGACWVSSAHAQCIDSNTAPPQAAAAGYNCKTFQWTCGGGIANCASGTGDTAGEIDSAQTYAQGFKWYWSNGVQPNHTTLSGDYSVDANGKIIVQSSVEDGGAFVLSTCGGPNIGTNSVWTVGKFFQHGFYAEAVMEYDATGFPSDHTGFYGFDGFWYPTVFTTGCTAGSASNECYETDNPDARAFDQSVAVHVGGGASQLNNNPSPLPNLSPIVETGNKWGMLSIPSAVKWYFNDALNGNPGTVVFSQGSALELYNSKQCFGFNSNTAFQTKYDSIKVWQVGPPPTRDVRGTAVIYLMSLLLLLCAGGAGAWRLGYARRVSVARGASQ